MDQKPPRCPKRCPITPLCRHGSILKVPIILSYVTHKLHSSCLDCRHKSQLLSSLFVSFIFLFGFSHLCASESQLLSSLCSTQFRGWYTYIFGLASVYIYVALLRTSILFIKTFEGWQKKKKKKRILFT